MIAFSLVPVCRWSFVARLPRSRLFWMSRHKEPANCVVLLLPGVRYILLPDKLNFDIAGRASCGVISRQSHRGLTVGAKSLRRLKHGAGIGVRPRPVIESIIHSVEREGYAGVFRRAVVAGPQVFIEGAMPLLHGNRRARRPRREHGRRRSLLTFHLARSRNNGRHQV